MIDATGNLEHRILRVEVIEEGVVQNQSTVQEYLRARTQALSSHQKRHIQRLSSSINHPSLITPPPDTNPLPLACGPSSYGTSSSGVLRGEPDDVEDHRSATCGSAGRRHMRSAGRSYRRTTTWSASNHPQSPIPLPTSVPPCE